MEDIEEVKRLYVKCFLAFGLLVESIAESDQQGIIDSLSKFKEMAGDVPDFFIDTAVKMLDDHESNTTFH